MPCEPHLSSRVFLNNIASSLAVAFFPTATFSNTVAYATYAPFNPVYSDFFRRHHTAIVPGIQLYIC